MPLNTINVAKPNILVVLNDSLGGISFGIDSEGNYGYYKYDETVGADTLVPFKSDSYKYLGYKTANSGATAQFYFTEAYSKVLLFCGTISNGTGNEFHFNSSVGSGNVLCNFAGLKEASAHRFKAILLENVPQNGYATLRGYAKYNAAFIIAFSV